MVFSVIIEANCMVGATLQNWTIKILYMKYSRIKTSFSLFADWFVETYFELYPTPLLHDIITFLLHLYVLQRK